MANEKPLVSVIMPVYNAAGTVARAIRSIQAQTEPRWELLAVDDGSADQSGSICDEFAAADARIRVFHTPNRGVSQARNTALAEARGEWIAFLDSDDWYEDRFLHTMLANADQMDMVVCTYQFVPACEKVQLIETAKEYDLRDSEALADFVVSKEFRYMHIVWGKLYRKERIFSLFLPNLSWSEDVLFNYENLNSMKQIRILPECMYYYTYLPQLSLSKCMQFNGLSIALLKLQALQKLLSAKSKALPFIATSYRKEVCSYFMRLLSIRGKSRADKLLVLGLQVNDALFAPVEPYRQQSCGLYRLLWNALKTRRPKWIYFVFSCLGVPYRAQAASFWRATRRKARNQPEGQSLNA